MGKLLRDVTGSVLVEMTIVFPLFMLLVFGTVDVAYMLYEWDLASKADYIGARTAVVSDPVVKEITNLPYDPTKLGDFCFDFGNGQSTDDCPPQNPTVCIATSATTGKCCSPTLLDCSKSVLFDPAVAPFSAIFSRMHAIFPRLQLQNVVISYAPNGLGFSGQPGGLPMNVTVDLQCVTHQFYFLSALMGWIFSTPTDQSGNFCPANGPLLPSFVTTTTLPSEDMVTN